MLKKTKEKLFLKIRFDNCKNSITEKIPKTIKP